MAANAELVSSNIKILVFSDLDGTLLDHYTYSFDAALPSIKRLSGLGIPIIPNTSKTFEEVILILEEMQLASPFITENGAAIYMPTGFLPQKPKGAIWKNGYWVKTFAQSRGYWQELTKRIKRKYPNSFEAFSEMNLERIAELTGLSASKAKLAATRQFSEPLLWKGSDEERDVFVEDINKMGAHALLGGRFLHICGDSNKGKALNWLCEEYARQHKEMQVKSIALGDGHNDIDMLEAADFAVRIASPSHAPVQLKRTEHNYLSKSCGPEGWAQVMNELIPQ